MSGHGWLTWIRFQLRWKMRFQKGGRYRRSEVKGLPTTPIILCVVVSRSYVTPLFEVDTDFKNVFTLKMCKKYGPEKNPIPATLFTSTNYSSDKYQYLFISKGNISIPPYEILSVFNILSPAFVSLCNSIENRNKMWKSQWQQSDNVFIIISWLSFPFWKTIGISIENQHQYSSILIYISLLSISKSKHYNH